MLEEDFLDLVGQLSRKAPMQEIWQQVDAFSPSGSAADLAATDLQVCPGSVCLGFTVLVS